MESAADMFEYEVSDCRKGLINYKLYAQVDGIENKRGYEKETSHLTTRTHICTNCDQMLGATKVEFRGSVSPFALRESQKQFNKKHLNSHERSKEQVIYKLFVRMNTQSVGDINLENV
ncbi:unnamed protein product [Timema podura]|uniref:Protein yippee-like n=1 Tax=Timema podura TaxID=61482 RepID=A0ABN7NNY8_TIMPD|nr:unnamed protein product [Timema podura]